MNDFRNIEDLLKIIGNNTDNFINYLLEYTRCNYTCLGDFVGDNIKYFNHFNLLHQHVFAWLILEDLKKENIELIGDYIVEFKKKYEKDISKEIASLESFISFLIEKANLRGFKLENQILDNLNENKSLQSNLSNRYREQLFPETIIDPRNFIKIYKEAMFVMIYLTYKKGERNDIIPFDDRENYILSEWIMNNRHYKFLISFDKCTLSYRMSEILQGKKHGLFD